MLQVGDQGAYSELLEKDNPNDLAIIYVPGISPMLKRAEELKGKPLSDAEVIRIRNTAPAIATTKEVAKATVKERGYE